MSRGPASPARPTTIAGAMAVTTDILRGAGILEPRREARLLLAAILDLNSLDLLTATETHLSSEQWHAAEIALSRRIAGEPLTRIAGRRGFWTLDLAISPEVLDPRPETELLVECALQHAEPRRRDPLSVLDLGTGSGCILLALLSELPEAWGIGVDRSPCAIAMARRNALASGLGERTSWVAGQWGNALSGPFDIIVANPPYIPSGAVATLHRSVRDHDPLPALDGGPDGLAPYRLILPQLVHTLDNGGIACLEVGRGQADRVARMARRHSLVPRIHKDLAGIHRCVTIRHEKDACNAAHRR